ncbi:MAG: type IV pilin protein [Pseudomonadota bacterium]
MSKRNQSGMSLIELLTVVVIIGILGAIVIPSYQDSVRKARRADSQAVILELAQWMERFYTENGRYDQDRNGNAVGPQIPAILQQSPKDAGGGVQHYGLVVGNLTERTFTITATPVGDQAGERCGNLTFDQAGTKGMNGTGLTVAQCW